MSCTSCRRYVRTYSAVWPTDSRALYDGRSIPPTLAHYLIYAVSPNEEPLKQIADRVCAMQDILEFPVVAVEHGGVCISVGDHPVHPLPHRIATIATASSRLASFVTSSSSTMHVGFRIRRRRLLQSRCSRTFLSRTQRASKLWRRLHPCSAAHGRLSPYHSA